MRYAGGSVVLAKDSATAGSGDSPTCRGKVDKVLGLIEQQESKNKIGVQPKTIEVILPTT